MQFVNKSLNNLGSPDFLYIVDQLNYSDGYCVGSRAVTYTQTHMKVTVMLLIQDLVHLIKIICVLQASCFPEVGGHILNLLHILVRE